METRDSIFQQNFISTGGVMGLRPTQGNEKRLGPASALYGTVTLSLSSRPKRTRISCHAELATSTYAPFHKERRMRLAKANKFDRKSGGAERRDLRFRGPF